MYRWVLSVCLHSTQLSILMESGLFPGSQRQFEQRTWDPSLSYVKQFVSYVACFCQGLAYVCTELAAPVAAWAGRGLEAFRTFNKQQQKVLPSMTRAYQQCFAMSPQSCHFGSHVRSLTWIHIVKILNALFWTSSILARHRNVCLLWHHPAVAAHGPDPLCAKLFRRICPQWDSIPKRKDADMRERFASIDLAQCRIACKTL